MDSGAEREAEAYDQAERGDDHWEQVVAEYAQEESEQPDAWQGEWSGIASSWSQSDMTF